MATERYIMANAEKREYIQGYRDRRTLNDLLELWWMYHGQHRRKAEEDRKQLRNIINELGADMQAVDLDKLKIIAWRSQKIAEGLKPSSANRYMNRLSGMFTVLKKIGLWDAEHPVREFLFFMYLHEKWRSCHRRKWRYCSIHWRATTGVLRFCV